MKFHSQKYGIIHRPRPPRLPHLHLFGLGLGIGLRLRHNRHPHFPHLHPVVSVFIVLIFLASVVILRIAFPNNFIV